jgi:dTDP-4-dehydrorhamnose 3,5-epimerase
MKPLDVEGAWSFMPRIHADRRGSFHEWFRNDELEAVTGRRVGTAQANCSTSVRGVIRGIHFSDVPPGQAKYITCTSGSILDVIVDIRRGSPSFGRWAAVPLTAENKMAVFVEEGLGHAFAALTDDATVFYLCSTPFDPGREHGVHPLDPDVGIEWPADLAWVLSDRDSAAPGLAAAASQGLLPDYAACKMFIDGLRSAGRPAAGAGASPGG